MSELSSQIRNLSPVKRRRKETNEKDEQEFESWYMKYAPKSLNDVAIHKRKLEDVYKLFKSMLDCKDQTRIMLLTGPSGCSKSTVITQLARQLVPEYRTKHTSMLQSSEDVALDIVEYLQMGTFNDFLTDAKYRTNQNLSMVLVEDLPNVLHADTRSAFQKSLLEWLYSPEESLPPLVICLTECEMDNESSSGYGVDHSFTAESVLGKELLSHPKLKRIRFNPINKTLMKKHLKNICLDNRNFMMQRGRWSQKDSVVDQLAAMTGDIRSAIANLQYWATSSADVPFTTREQSLTYFHIIGKVLHGSHECSDHDMVNSLMSNSKSHVSNDNFRLGLHENYCFVNGGNLNIDTVHSVADCLSESDLLGALPESTEFALRKIRHTLSAVDKNSVSQKKAIFPREWKVRQLQREFGIFCEDYSNVDFYRYGNSCKKRDLCMFLAYYGPLIRAKRNYKRKSLNHHMSTLDRITQNDIAERYNDIVTIDPDLDVLERIGGIIKTVDEDPSFVSTDDSEVLGRYSLEQVKELRDDKLKKLQSLQLIEAPESDVEELQDPIEDTDVDDDDDSIYDLLSQQQPAVNESLSDSDLEDL